MSGFFGVVSKRDCVADLFYGTDYHSHLGTRRGGLAVYDHGGGFTRHIHDISNSQFRSKFSGTVSHMSGSQGIGVISDYEDQPLIVGSHLGTYAIVTVGAVNNLTELVQRSFMGRLTHYTHMNDGEVNPTEMVAALINEGTSFAEGIRNAQEAIQGSCSLLLLTPDGVYAARDRYGRTPVILGAKEGASAVALESSSLPNLGYHTVHDLGPGEIIHLQADGAETLRAGDEEMRMCAFFWVYFGFPASTYEGVNVELSRYRSGAFLARRDDVEVDYVSGVPDSGSGHGLGYAHEARIPFKRPFVKYTPTWARSFTPPKQSSRNRIARMKLIPVPEIIRGQRILFCDDSIVRGTQLRDITTVLRSHGAKEVHVRIACPPLLFRCNYLNFTRSSSELELAGRRAMQDLSGRTDDETARIYSNPDSPEHAAMVRLMARNMNVATLRFQRLEDLVAAIGLPKSKLCTCCWDGEGEPACGTCPVSEICNSNTKPTGI